MNFSNLLHATVDETLQRALWVFLPELALCATIVLLLLVRMIQPLRWISAFYVVVVGVGAAVFLVPACQYLPAVPVPAPAEIFGGLLIYDTFSAYMRGLLLLFVLLWVLLTRISGVPDRDEATDVYTLALGAALGMCLMVAANHMLIVFLGIEMASVPSYALAGMMRRKRAGSEASLKFAVYGAGTAGVMLYGISLVCGVLGSPHFPTMAQRLAELLAGDSPDRIAQMMVLALGAAMLMVGLAFKLSAVPFHFWAPDVFEGAPAEIGAFLSVASKAAALALLVRVGLGLTASAQWDLLGALAPARHFAVLILSLLAAVTCTFGNLAAYGQTNLKRLLAYSTIAHAGYMMMPVAAAVALAGENVAAAQWAVGSLAFYVALYLFMNLGAFAAVAFVRDAAGTEAIDGFAGLVRRSPGLAICLSLILFSLVGLPPLAGFAGKFAIFLALVRANLIALLVVGALNTVLSLFYYLRVVKVMILSSEPARQPAPRIPIASVAGFYCLLVTVPVVVLGVLWDSLFGWAQAAAATLL